MREFLFFGLLNAIWANVQRPGYTKIRGCGIYKYEEYCEDNVCSGSLESKNTFAGNDQLLKWKGCDESIILKMKDMFPGLELKHDNPKKCKPICIKFVTSMCDPKIIPSSAYIYQGRCTKEGWFEKVYSLSGPAISYQSTTMQPTTTTTTTTTQSVEDRQKKYQGKLYCIVYV